LKPIATIEGAERINRALFRASRSVTRKVLLSGMRKAATPLVKAMRTNLGANSGRDYKSARYYKESGGLKKSIGKITGKSKRFASLYVGPRVKRKFKDKGFIGHFVEFGKDTGYDLNFKGRRYVQKAFESESSKVENILEEHVLKAAMKFLK
jgi:hypothetical protein|tara:strand:- start:444 stop:899 length:456 start_codon:yes stop_codon:yes gene_type:complete